jgi:A/G-specific adenine glycosylase
MMDMGATLCTRSKPACLVCPLVENCQAAQQGNPLDYPGKKPSKIHPEKTALALLLQNAEGEILLLKRPPTGIWGGLWSFPEFSDESALHAWLQDYVGEYKYLESLPTLTHGFSHYTLLLHPKRLCVEKQPARIMEGEGWVWYKAGSKVTGGLSAAVRHYFHDE